jgi:hypothetical protein
MKQIVLGTQLLLEADQGIGKVCSYLGEATVNCSQLQDLPKHLQLGGESTHSVTLESVH